ncbi:MAG TPA: disulfide bond formation protein B [Rhodocyclaceae bacterium]|nr:disulfide bond formation protein B [Rhodocyclaceae bacterium]
MNMLNKLSPRAGFLLAFLVCAGLIAFGLVLQHVEGLEPCPLCILQRYAFVACGLVALIAGLHNPTGFMRRVYGALIALTALAGGSVSVRQSWLQHFPPNVSVCGPDLEYMISHFPLASSLPMLFRGEGDCSKVDWTLLGLSIAEWALLCFIALIVFGVWQTIRRWPQQRSYFGAH